MAITTGDLLTKVNFNNGAKSQRYFRVFRDNSLRWAKKEKDLTNPKVYKSCKKYSFICINSLKIVLIPTYLAN